MVERSRGQVAGCAERGAQWEPLGHGRQAEASLPPKKALYVPALHSWQSSTSSWRLASVATTIRFLPAEQALHRDALDVLANLPPSHTAHAAEGASFWG